ncbi:DUF4350 domain-containing protein [Lysobacter silvisoli]|uniref:DUF4350 domain-containing protein n=1 Tax=Lysobacter silvisoli TaxID=2293254 RepID=A0A371JYS1_9GAMM|nr:DUF4350 domain-containing protein [Lysobacter silvisoli]RDZ26815.1 DUF4350 domain-containing protein [Lysobacter silvisoli]
MNLRTVLATVLVVLLLVGAGVWFWRSYERVEETIELPRSGEAASNPLYVLKLALIKDGAKVKTRQRLLPDEHVLGARDTVLLLRDPRSLSPSDSQALLRFVGAGGHLIVRTPPPGELSASSEIPLLGALGVKFFPQRPVECVAMYVEKQDSHVEFCQGRRFLLMERAATPLHAWGAYETGYVFARLPQGRGSVDVIADLDFAVNAAGDEHAEAINDVPHLALVRQLLAPNYRAGTIHLIYAADMPSLWKLLFLRSWMAWAPLLLALLLWLWLRMQRFGPLLPAPASERRSLLEHIVASGEHAYRYGYGHLLHAAVRQAFLLRLRRRDPHAAALEGEPQAALLAERFKLAPADIRDALATPLARDHAAFRSRIATLIRLRNSL